MRKTFDTLASTPNQHAVDVLIAALDVSSAEARTLAVAALIRRESTRGQIEIIRRLPGFTDETRTVVLQQAGRMKAAFKHCLTHGERELRLRALEIVDQTEQYDQVETLLELLEREGDELDEEIAVTFQHLVQQLYERSTGTKRGSTGYVRNVAQIKPSLLTWLTTACSAFPKLRHHQSDVITAILVLADPEHVAVKRVLGHASVECRELASELFVTSRHPGVMQFVLNCVDQNYPHPRALEAIAQREDADFVQHLLRWFPRKLSQLQQKNLRQITSVAWLRAAHPSLETLEAPLQSRVVDFLAAVGLSQEDKLSVQTWLVQNGSAAGRLAASNILSSLEGQAVEQIIFNSLNSNDETIQAWATSQLRSQHIPETFSLLIERLDSPLEAVREAAREELSSFDVEMLLGIFDHIDPEVCRRAGNLAFKIDPECCDKLSRELAHPVCRNRIRAARAARMMGLHRRVVPALLAMLEHGDSLVRRTAAEVLDDVPMPEVVHALERLQEDPSPRVRETVAASLAKLREGASAAREYSRES